jgi:hypothetical protein
MLAETAMRWMAGASMGLGVPAAGLRSVRAEAADAVGILRGSFDDSTGPAAACCAVSAERAVDSGRRGHRR